MDMKVEELIGSKVWIKTDQFRSVPGKIAGTSCVINLDDIKSSVSRSTFKIEMPSGDVVEILGSNISKIENAACVPAKPSESRVQTEMALFEKELSGD
jgi:CYTH domain-containing protein